MEDVLSLRKMEGKGETQGIMTARETVRRWQRQRGKEETLGEGKQHVRGMREARKMEGKRETQGITTARETVRRWRRQRGKEETLGEGKQHARRTREARRFMRSDLAGLPSLLFDQIQINKGGKRDSMSRPTPLSETRPRRRGVLPEAAASGDGTSLWASQRRTFGLNRSKIIEAIERLRDAFGKTSNRQTFFDFTFYITGATAYYPK
ncbi:hypothetical protein ACLOJK_033118 [Asimina triloba]